MSYQRHGDTIPDHVTIHYATATSETVIACAACGDTIRLPYPGVGYLAIVAAHEHEGAAEGIGR